MNGQGGYHRTLLHAPSANGELEVAPPAQAVDANAGAINRETALQAGIAYGSYRGCAITAPAQCGREYRGWSHRGSGGCRVGERSPVTREHRMARLQHMQKMFLG
jgi:hypothetical protein